jgi:hypothetical protein
MWYSAISSEIEKSNILALKNGSRLPEILKWFEEQQENICSRTKNLDEDVVVEYNFKDPNNEESLKTIQMTLSVNRLYVNYLFSYCSITF